jgi:hypothetical protein
VVPLVSTVELSESIVELQKLHSRGLVLSAMKSCGLKEEFL